MNDELFAALAKAYMNQLAQLQRGYIKTTADWKYFQKIKADYHRELAARVERAVSPEMSGVA